MTGPRILIVLFSFLGISATAEVIATVGAKKITLKEFQKKFKHATLSAPINPPTKQQFLEDLVRFEMGVLEAEKRKLRDDVIVQERIKQEIYKALLENEIGKSVNTIKVTEAEMKNWYKKNPEIRASHILIQYRPDTTKKDKKAARKRAGEILDEVRKSKRPFDELVQLFSDDTISKRNNGDIGWQSRLTLVPRVYNAIVKMRPNQISGIIESPFGFHIVKLTGRRSYENADRRQIHSAVFEVKKKAIFDKFFDKLRPKYSVKTNKKLLNKVKD